MCCFSGPVHEVSKTRIFARLVTPQRQALAYQMSLNTPNEVAMILPIPVDPGSSEDAVEFINLSDYPHFFDDLSAGFPSKSRLSYSYPPTDSLASNSLKVQSVGSFEASFVPTIKDFARLDQRFRLPEKTWDQFPQYANYGFAVFKLKKGKRKIHPMAFTFPSRLISKSQLFFPTVHIHDGKIHPREEFDHLLYAQTWPKAGLSSRQGWEESSALTASFAEPKKSKGLLWGRGHLYRLELSGLLANKDTLAQAIAL